MFINCTKLKNEMVDKHLNYKTLSQKSGVPMQTLNRILCLDFAQVKTATISKICDVLSVSPDVLAVSRNDYQYNLIMKYSELSLRLTELQEKNLDFAAAVVKKEIKRLEKELT